MIIKIILVYGQWKVTWSPTLPTRRTPQRLMFRLWFLCFIFINPLATLSLEWEHWQKILLCAYNQLCIMVNFSKKADRLYHFTLQSPSQNKKDFSKATGGILWLTLGKFMLFFFFLVVVTVFQNRAWPDTSLEAISCCQWLCDHRPEENNWVVNDLSISLRICEEISGFCFPQIWP